MPQELSEDVVDLLPWRVIQQKDMHTCLDCGGALKTASASLAGYLVAVCLLVFWGRVRYIVLLAVTFSGVQYLSAVTAQPFVAWTERTIHFSGDGIELKKHLLRVEGRSKTNFRIALPDTSFPNLPVPVGTVWTFLGDARQQAAARSALILPTGLMSRGTIRLTEIGRMLEVAENNAKDDGCDELNVSLSGQQVSIDPVPTPKGCFIDKSSFRQENSNLSKGLSRLWSDAKIEVQHTSGNNPFPYRRLQLRLTAQAAKPE